MNLSRFAFHHAAALMSAVLAAAVPCRAQYPSDFTGLLDPQAHDFSRYDQTLNQSAVFRAARRTNEPYGFRNAISVYHFMNAQYDPTRANVMMSAFLGAGGETVNPANIPSATSIRCTIVLGCWCPASGPDDDYIGLLAVQNGYFYASPLIAELSGTSIIGTHAFSAGFPLVPGTFTPMGGASAPPIDFGPGGSPIEFGVWFMSRVTAGHGSNWYHDASVDFYGFSVGFGFPPPVPPVITVHPGSVNTSSSGMKAFGVGFDAAPANSAVFSCRATGGATYRWYSCAPGSEEWSMMGNGPNLDVVISGVDTGDLMITNPTLATDGTRYRCLARNPAGQTWSNSAELITNASRTAPVFTRHPVDMPTSPPLGATFTAIATGTPTPSLQWQRLTSGSSTWTNLADDATFSGTESTTLTLAATTLAMVGDQFRCVATTTGTPVAVSDTATLRSVVVHPATKEVGFDPAVYSVAVHTGTPWSVENTASWVTITRGSWGTTGTFDVSVAANPTAVDRTAVIQIGGATHTITQRANGASLAEVLGTGEDLYGQLGISTLCRSAFEQMGTGVKAVAGGVGHTLLLKTDGTLWTTGYNRVGQLGVGSFATQKTVPQQVASGVSAIAAGENQSFYLKTDGTLWGTGQNVYGQLGLGNPTDRNAFVQVTTGVAAVASGRYHTLFVKTDGTLWATGYNGSGQLGDGTTTQRNSPVQITTGVASVTAGGSHSLFVKTDGTLWAMGSNGDGQLGDGSTTQRNAPVQIATGVAAAAAGDLFSAFVKTDGTLWTMGNGSSGQLGRGTTTGSSTPVQAASNVAVSKGVAAGWAHVAFIDTSGALRVFGNGEFGQLGHGPFSNQSTPLQVLSGATAIAAGQYHTLALKADGSWWVTGANAFGAAGDGTASYRTTRAAVITRMRAVSAGGHHSLFLKNDGTLWAAGDNRVGQIGDGSTTRRSTPVQIASSVASMSAGLMHSAYVTTDGRLYIFGNGAYGQLGTGGTTNVSTPYNLASSVAMVCAGAYHTLYVKTDGTVWSAGSNWFGALGNGGTNWSLTPTQVATGAVAVAAGGRHSLILKADGTLWASGLNSNGQLGDTTTTQRVSFVQIATGVASISAGEYHSLFVKTDGTLWAMGSNGSGQLGDGTKTQRATPVQVATGVVIASAGSGRSMYIKTDGTLWAMGHYPYGSYGREVIDERSTPTQVTDGVSTVSAGGSPLFIRNAAKPATIAAPTIDTPPADAAVAMLTAATFSITASSSPIPTYQWQRKAAGASLWTDLASAGRYAGTGTATLTVSNTTMAMSGDQFRCVLNNGAPQDVASNAATLTITKAPATIAFDFLNQTYDGFPKNVTATTSPEGLTMTFHYEGSTTPPTNAGTYAVTATINDTSYQGTATASLVIAKATAAVNIDNSTHLYDGTPKGLTATTIPEGLTTTVTYGGQSTGPTTVGVHEAQITVVDANYTYSGTANVVIQPVVSLGQSGTVTSAAGGSTTLTASAGGGTDTTYQWQMLPDTGLAAIRAASLRATGALSTALTGWIDIPGATGATYTLPCAQAFHSGTYRVLVTVNGAPAVSGSFVVQVASTPTSNARLMNLSTRAFSSTGDATLIPGFVLNGSGTKRVLIRGIGPTLGGFGVGGTLPDPTMHVVSGGIEVASNDDWGTNANKAAIISTSETVGAFGLIDGSRDAALLLDLPPGQYTVPTSDVAAGTGVAMVELYDADAGTPTATLVNISNRGFVGVGDNVMIPGIVVSNEGARTFLIRAVGPTLAGFGVGGTLADPVLTVFRGNTPILSNDDWGTGADAATTSSTAATVGAFPLTAGSKDAAFVVTLPPGPYTVQATGRNSSTGVALVEVYLVP